jgi:hypothetical protein
MDDVCSGPDVDDARWDTKAKAIATIDARMASMSHLSGGDIAEARLSCLKYLREAKEYLAGPNGPYSR